MLRDVGVESELEIQGRVRQFREAAERIATEITAQRQLAVADRTTEHAADRLKIQARGLSEQIASLDEAISELIHAKDRDSRHLHEIETLSLKFRRSQSARAVLSGVGFRPGVSLPQDVDQSLFH